MVRIVLLVLTVLSLAATGLLTTRLLAQDELIDESISRSERLEQALKAFEFDGQGNVAPEQRGELQSVLMSAQLAAERIAKQREVRSDILVLMGVGAGSTLIFGLLWRRARRPQIAA